MVIIQGAAPRLRSSTRISSASHNRPSAFGSKEPRPGPAGRAPEPSLMGRFIVVTCGRGYTCGGTGSRSSAYGEFTPTRRQPSAAFHFPIFSEAARASECGLVHPFGDFALNGNGHSEKIENAHRNPRAPNARTDGGRGCAHVWPFFLPHGIVGPTNRTARTGPPAPHPRSRALFSRTGLAGRVGEPPPGPTRRLPL